MNRVNWPQSGLLWKALASQVLCGTLLVTASYGQQNQYPYNYYNRSNQTAQTAQPRSTTGAATNNRPQGYPNQGYANPAYKQGTAANAPTARTASSGYGATGQKPAAAAPATARPAAARPESDVPAPSTEQALRLHPVQKEVDYSKPGLGDVARCKVYAQKLGNGIGWIVEDGNGQILRKFIDTNGDNKVDQWCYYKDGVEVYRDIDSDFNGKADQYRWFNTAGTRWGIDREERGRIDSWRTISAEEVTTEVVAALANEDSQRFARLVLSTAEFKSLGLGPAKTKRLSEKTDGLADRFSQTLGQQKAINQNTKWVQFSGNQPGIVPAGTEGSTKEIQVYENVVAIAQTGSDHVQVQIGTLIKVGESWRVVDLPQVTAEGRNEVANNGFFFQATPTGRTQAVGGSGPTDVSQKMLADLETLDKEGAQATTPEEQAVVLGKRADLIEKIADQATKPEERTTWLRQLTDMIGAAVQSGTFPQGAKRLEALYAKVQKNDQDSQMAGYVRFRQLSAEYGLAMQAKGADFSKIQSEWLKKLEQYVADYPKSSDAAEAMLQLGTAQEGAGQEDEAKKWYGRVRNDFAGTLAGRKATGAQTRLDSVGKVLPFQGKSSTGEMVELSRYRGRVVLLQFWATWCDPCKADMATLKELAAKYRQNFAVVGVNLDNTEQTMSAYLSENPLPWPQVFESGGQDSPPALDLGILTLPTMILINQEGRVVNRNITATELEGEIKKLLR